MLILLTGAVSEDPYRLKLGVSKGNLYLESALNLKNCVWLNTKEFYYKVLLNIYFKVRLQQAVSNLARNLDLQVLYKVINPMKTSLS